MSDLHKLKEFIPQEFRIVAVSTLPLVRELFLLFYLPVCFCLKRIQTNIKFAVAPLLSFFYGENVPVCYSVMRDLKTIAF